MLEIAAVSFCSVCPVDPLPVPPKPPGAIKLDGWMDNFCLTGAFVSNNFLLRAAEPMDELFLKSLSAVEAVLVKDLGCSTRSGKSSSPKNICPWLLWSGEVELDVVGDMVREGD